MEANGLRNIWDEVETGLGSPGRIRILRIMLKKSGECFTKYALEKATGLKPIDVRKNLSILIKLGWIKENPCDPKTYEINMENEIIKALADFFKKLPKN
jgi:transcription initiation factor IIE alpha subunit